MIQEFPPRHTIKNELDAAEIRKLEAELTICVEDNNELRAEVEQLQALLIDTVMSMERGGFHIELQKRIRAALEPKP